MRNIWRVFARDARRILRVPQAWIIVVGVIVTPSLYAWFNIVGFWNPYENTGNIDVAVVNLDRGASSSEAGQVDAGDEIVAKLHENTQLGWQFVDEDEAMDAVNSGRYYAAVIIPEAFSSDLLSITTGNFTQPQLQYYVNEKLSAIAPKVTDTGSSRLETQITSTFTSVVADTVTEKIVAGSLGALNDLDAAQGTALADLDSAMATIDSVRSNLSGVADGLSSSRSQLSAADSALAHVDDALADASSALDQASGIVTDAQTQVADFSSTVTTAYADSQAALAEASAQAHAVISDLTAQLQQSQQLADASDTLQRLQQAADTIDQAAQDAAAGADALQNVAKTTLPSISSSVAQLSGSAAALSSTIDAQRAQVGQARALLTQIDQQISLATETLAGFDTSLATTADDLATLRTDVSALGSAAIVDRLGQLSGLDPEQIAAFMASPVEVDQQVIFPVQSYGAAMASMFTNLSLWIGPFVLMVILKLEVDREGIPGITVSQAYWARWLLLAVLVALQGLLVACGELVIGVQPASAFAFVGTSMLIGLSYLSIIYALSVSFGHVGKGLCVVLVIMQIPGASGIYPIEMMPGFFRAIYPFLPFTYGIDAMRETISGFSGLAWGRNMGVLLLYVVASFVLGLLLRRWLGNLNRLFNREIAASGLLIAEDVQITGGGYRLSEVIHVLSNRQEFTKSLERRTAVFRHRYRLLRRWAVVVGVLGVAVIGALLPVIPGGKATVLGLWVGWALLLFAFVVVIEYIRFSLMRAGEIGRMPDQQLRAAVLADGGEQWLPHAHVRAGDDVEAKPEDDR